MKSNLPIYQIEKIRKDNDKHLDLVNSLLADKGFNIEEDKEKWIIIKSKIFDKADTQEDIRATILDFIEDGTLPFTIEEYLTLWQQETIPGRKLKEAITIFNFNYLDLAEKFHQIQPYFYTTSNLWWLWNFKLNRYEITDEIEILNSIDEILQDPRTRTTSSTFRNEIIEALKRIGRKKTPLNLEKTWIQFKNKIIDIRTGQIKEISPKYLCVNPIDWELSESEETPIIDKLFIDWVGEDYKQTLYEILAYCMLPDYPFHVLFWLYGSGSNGKSIFLKVLDKFIGTENVCTSGLQALIKNRFETAKLYKKLVCEIGETDFSELRDTQSIKKLTGGDKIGFEFKNKNPFDDYSYAKIIIATNSVPTSLDNTDGYHRRNMIIDFPNKFTGRKDILAMIPDSEFNSLASKCCRILKEILDKRQFHNEGSIEVKRIRYEERSNPLTQFVNEFTDKSIEEYIYKYEFKDKFLTWLKENGHRVWNERELGIKTKAIFEEGRRGEKQYRAFLGIQWKESNQNRDNQDNQEVLTCSNTYAKSNSTYPVMSVIPVTESFIDDKPNSEISIIEEKIDLGVENEEEQQIVKCILENPGNNKSLVYDTFDIVPLQRLTKEGVIYEHPENYLQVLQ